MKSKRVTRFDLLLLAEVNLMERRVYAGKLGEWKSIGLLCHGHPDQKNPNGFWPCSSTSGTPMNRERPPMPRKRQRSETATPEKAEAWNSAASRCAARPMGPLA